MRILIAAVALLAVPSVASAQSTGVDGVVTSQMSLSLDQPAKGFPAFSKAKTYTTSLHTSVTATDGSMLLSISDGDAASGSSRGHLKVGSKRLAAPLEATVGNAAFQPLDASVDPLLKRWSVFGSNVAATIKLRQKVTAKAKGDYRKLVLVTLSTEMP